MVNVNATNHLAASGGLALFSFPRILPSMWQIALYWLLAVAPSLPILLLYLAFRRVLLSKKFEMVMLLKRGETLTKYLSAYGGAQLVASSAQSDRRQRDTLVEGIVDQIFRLRYSTLEYAPAIAFSVIMISLLTGLALAYLGIPLGLPELLSSGLRSNEYLRNLLAAGIGAFIWGIYDLSDRYRSNDFPPDALFTLSSRILVLGASGAVVGTLVNEKLAWPIAFGVGVLPMPMVRDFIAQRTRYALKIPASSEADAKPPLSALQGWNSMLAEKLNRADISTIQELACTNQFQLFLRSNLEWRVILDLSDQALLILYVGEAVQKLYPLGIRSAVELAEIDWSKDDDYFDADLPQAQAIQRIASALEMDELAARLLIRSLSQDATASFLGALWSDDTPDDQQDEAPAGVESH